MVRFKVSKQGFTLVEMLVAMAIFIAFTGVLIGSYTSIVRAQREANEYRIMYSEARKVFETLIFEFRDSMIDYGYYGEVGLSGGGEVSDTRKIFFISKDGNKKVNIIYDSEKGQLNLQYHYLQNTIDASGQLSYFPDPKVISLNDPSLVKLVNFRIYVTPNRDPYSLSNVDKDSVQFQPKVTIFATFRREFLDGQSYEMDLQTSVSSRVYNQIIANPDSKKEKS